MLSTAKPKVAAKSSMDWKVAEVDLFKCVLARHAPVKVDYQGLEQDMRALGYDCTAKAITHRIQKIKSASPPSAIDPDAATPASSPTKAVAAKKPRASPTKKAAANGKGKEAAAKGKAIKRKHDEIQEDGSDATEGEGDKKMKVKEENGDETEEDENAGAGMI
ncbi:hypothetical protein XPA_005281 [Xanthoria parietina]